jgi:hypothetical protein
LSFARWTENQQLIVISNFDADNGYQFNLKIPKELINTMPLTGSSFECVDMLYNEVQTTLKITDGQGEMMINLKPLESFIFKINN